MRSTIDKSAGGSESPLSKKTLQHLRELLGYKAFQMHGLLDASRRLKAGEDPSTVRGYVTTPAGGFRKWTHAIAIELWNELSEEEREVWRTTAESLIASTDSCGSYLPWLMKGQPVYISEDGSRTPLDPSQLRVATNGGYVRVDPDAPELVAATYERDRIEWTFPTFVDPATEAPDGQ